MKKKSIYFLINEIEVNLTQEKINFINYSYQKVLLYWKEVAVKKASTENETKKLTDLALSTFFLIRKAAIKNAKKMNIDEIFFYLKSQYSTYNRNQITFIQEIASQEDVPSFEAISDYLMKI